MFGIIKCKYNVATSSFHGVRVVFITMSLFSSSLRYKGEPIFTVYAGCSYVALGSTDSHDQLIKMKLH